MTISIVTGDGPRCGSAMMMRALQAGGMDIAYDPACDNIVEEAAAGDYHPNPSGVFELPWRIYRAEGFPLQYDGKAIKLFPPPAMTLDRIPFRHPWTEGDPTEGEPGGYRIIWLHRDFEARLASYERTLRDTNAGSYVVGKGYEDDMRLRQLMASMCRATINARPDVWLIEADYEDIVRFPVEVFTQMRECGWPIDPEKAAAIVDPALKRF